MTIATRVLRYAARYPGRTATEIANALKALPSTVSAALWRESKRPNPRIFRQEGRPIDGRWRPKGPGTGDLWYRVEPTVEAMERTVMLNGRRIINMSTQKFIERMEAKRAKLARYLQRARDEGVVR